jgi:photosystem II stability/assembly factor-like uncharacterized protein
MKKTLLFISFLLSIGLQAQNFWTEVTPFGSSPDYSPKQISIVDDNVVWVSGANNTVPITSKWSRSLDTGLTWQEGDIDLGNHNLAVSSIHALSASKAFVSVYSTNPGDFGGVWVTGDSGTTWTKQPTALYNSVDSFANFIYFFDANNGVVAGDPENGYFEIYVTSDSGANWIRVPSANIPTLLAGEYGYTLKFEARDNSVWFGTNKGRLFKSDNKGWNWVAYQSPMADFDNSDPHDNGDFAFKNQNDGLLMSENYELWKTADGGATWTPIVLVPDNDNAFNFNIECVPQTTNAYFGWGEHLQLSPARSSTYTLDGGLSWNSLFDEIPRVNPLYAKFKSGTVGFCIGYENLNELKFYRLTDPLYRLNGGLATSTFEKDAFKIAPNPTKGVVRISGVNISSVTVFDLTGKTIKAQNNFPADAVDLDMSAFQNGIYFAKVEGNDGSIATLKILKN